MRWKFATLMSAVAMLWGGFVSAQGTQTGILRGACDCRRTDKASLPGATVSIKSPRPAGRLGPPSPKRTAGSSSRPAAGHVQRHVRDGRLRHLEKAINLALGQAAVPRRHHVRCADGPGDRERERRADRAARHHQTAANITTGSGRALATNRDAPGRGTLSTGLTGNTPNAGAVARSRVSFSYDNVFLLDGVDINDNLFGSPRTSSSRTRSRKPRS